MDEIAVKFAIAKILISEVQDLNKGTNELTEIYKLMEEQLRLHVVSQRSEQLIDFVKWFETLSAEELVWYDGKYAETFMAINCG